MAPSQKTTGSDQYEVRTDEQGRQWVDLEDPNEAARRHLNPNTGSEVDEQWPMPQPEEDAPPPLDLDLAWSEIAAATPLTVDEKEPLPEAEEVETRNAIILIRELRAHLLASTLIPRKESQGGNGEQDGDDHVENGESSQPEGSAADAVEEEKEMEKSGKAERDGEDLPKSVYGASMLLKLQWEDRSKQKAIPQRTYKELALFISDITMNLETVLEHNPKAAKEVLDTMAMDMTAILLTRYLDGIETCTDVLEECCYTLLTLCAERASPKVMHLAMKAFVSKIDKVYVEATAYLLVQPLIVLWGKVLSRIPRKRRAFLADFIKVYDLLKPLADTFNSAFVPDTGGVGVERSGRVTRVPEVLLDLFKSLVETQCLQRETDPTIALEVDVLGREKVRQLSTVVPENPSNSNASGKQADETVDWVCERAMTLARVLLLQVMLWTRLDPPPGEERNVPKSKAKEKKREKKVKRWAVSREEKEQSFVSCLSTLEKLGWSNPVLACQIGAVGVNLEPATRSLEQLRYHIGEDIRSKKERKNTLYSIASVGYFLCASLRHGTRARMLGADQEDERCDYDVDLSDTAFELLEPKHAFDLVLPYLMNLIAQGHATISTTAIYTLRAFLDRIPDGSYKDFRDVLWLHTGANCTGRKACLHGLAHHLTKALAAFDDPKHRRIAYETIQAVLRKSESVEVQYSICENLFYDTRRPVIAGQVMTEMKNILQTADRRSWQNGAVNAVEASSLRSRFAEACFPRYFVPRKELLASINPIATAASMLLFLAISDKHFRDHVGEHNEKLRDEIQRRMKLCKEYGKLGKECIRALASVAEHDRKNVPTSQLAKANAADAMALYAASGRTLNQSIGALSFVDSALNYLQ